MCGIQRSLMASYINGLCMNKFIDINHPYFKSVSMTPHLYMHANIHDICIMDIHTHSCIAIY